MKVWIASDHAGFDLKAALVAKLSDVEWVDLGPTNSERTDYPDWTDKLVSEIKKSGGMGVLICGSGEGMAMRANRHKGIRAALCWNEEVTQLSRSHNDANVLCLGSRWNSPEQAAKMTRIFLETPFEGGRHTPRVEKLDR